MSAKHFDDGKPDLSLIPSVAEESMARAMMHGTNKYGRYNYCKGHEAGKLIASARRHLSAWYNGEENDKESGVSHLGHAMCNIAMLLRQIELGTMRDDRYTAPVAGREVRPSPLSEEERQPLDEEALTYLPERMAVVEAVRPYYNSESVLYSGLEFDERHGAGRPFNIVEYSEAFPGQLQAAREYLGKEKK